ncbi:hypothetical protein [Streptomyces sp. NRRL S-455]|uniref:hypothetical protein n=1 Tax=Streptomyces sp. NRRL S-455 TaxID=1463908 RepID=UPI00131A6074|nr:hypothetical protein [Streptomyces sp. NRRL S-455]
MTFLFVHPFIDPFRDPCDFACEPWDGGRSQPSFGRQPPLELSVKELNIAGAAESSVAPDRRRVDPQDFDEVWQESGLAHRVTSARKGLVGSDEVEKAFGPVDGISVLGQLAPEVDAFLVGSENPSGCPPPKEPVESPLRMDDLRGSVEAELSVDGAGEVGHVVPVVGARPSAVFDTEVMVSTDDPDFDFPVVPSGAGRNAGMAGPAAGETFVLLVGPGAWSGQLGQFSHQQKRGLPAARG